MRIKGASVQRDGRILIIETDELIRELLERWLSEAGYDVVAQPSSIPANIAAPRLVIANISRPRDAGALVQSLESAYKAPILLMSGRFRRGLAASKNAARELGVRKVLPKPFTREELLAAVDESLAARR
jgi:DNA-binding response OmpR family regulator